MLLMVPKVLKTVGSAVKIFMLQLLMLVIYLNMTWQAIISHSNCSYNYGFFRWVCDKNFPSAQFSLPISVNKSYMVCSSRLHVYAL